MTQKRFETLTRLECLDLLRENHLGRLAFLERVGVVPLITPVNYLLDQDTVVFRTDPGSKLVAAVRGAPVAFEIDGAEEGDRVGWSVIVRGHAVEVTDETERERLSHGSLESWAPGPKSHYVRVVPGPITGRRISVHPR
jgi:nitroimidazol reductase NimA-like FMN-containing flavoprotein (pyridoxamine 5'-phosphate oxidase superfamily)